MQIDPLPMLSFGLVQREEVHKIEFDPRSPTLYIVTRHMHVA